MASISEISPLIQENVRKSVGMSSNDLNGLSSAELDTIVTLLKAGPSRAKYRVGGYYGAEGPIDTLLMTEDQLIVVPIVVERFIVVEEIGVDVTTAGTEGDLYIALYADRGDSYPGASIHISAAKAVTTTFKSTTGLDIELPPGLYWAGAVVNQVTTTVATLRSVLNSYGCVGLAAGTDDTNSCGYAEAAVTGAPNATFTSTVTVVGEGPRVLFKVKQA